MFDFAGGRVTDRAATLGHRSLGRERDTWGLEASGDQRSRARTRQQPRLDAWVGQPAVDTSNGVSGQPSVSLIVAG